MFCQGWVHCIFLIGPSWEDSEEIVMLETPKQNTPFGSTLVSGAPQSVIFVHKISPVTSRNWEARRGAWARRNSAKRSSMQKNCLFQSIKFVCSESMWIVHILSYYCGDCELRMDFVLDDFDLPKPRAALVQERPNVLDSEMVCLSLLNFLGRARQRVACDNIFEAELHCENFEHTGFKSWNWRTCHCWHCLHICYARYNDKNPCQKIEIGCAVMKVNGITESAAVDLSPKQLALFRVSRNTYRRQILVEQNLSMSDAHCGEVCSICQDEMDIADTASLPCGHCFHRVCVKEWLISRSLRCPLCNDEIGKRPKSLLVWWATWR